MLPKPDSSLSMVALVFIIAAANETMKKVIGHNSGPGEKVTLTICFLSKRYTANLSKQKFSVTSLLLGAVTVILL